MIEEQATGRRRGRSLALAAVALTVAVLLLALWLARKPIAADLIDRELARRGVPARYEVKKIGLHTQRLEGVSIGDPRTPDLTADWIEVDLTPTFGAPAVREVRAGGVRLRGRFVGGRISLGTLDRLLPGPSGAPFRLPDLRVALSDARIALALPAGRVDVHLEGQGNVAKGFSGIYAASAPALTLGGCRLARVAASGGIAMRDGSPTLTGPVAVDKASCGAADLTALRGTAGVTFTPELDGWRGQARFGSGDTLVAGWSARNVAAQLMFAGDAAATKGSLSLQARGLSGFLARAASARLAGRYTIARRREPLDRQGGTETAVSFDGVATGQGVALAAAPRLDGLARGVVGTPLEALVRSLAQVAQAAGRDAAVKAGLSIATLGGRGALHIEAAEASGGGARARFAGGEGVRLTWPGGLTPQVDGRLTVTGAGVPQIVADIRQRRPGAPLSGMAVMAPFVAAGSRVTLAPVRFADGRFATAVEMSGPLAGGRIERVTLPVSGQLGRGGFLLNPRCAPLSFDRLTLAGLDLAPARLTLCPAGRALVDDGRVSGVVAGPRLRGRLGQSPIAIAAERARFDGGAFALRGLAVRLGESDRVSRLDVASMTGSTGNGLSGRFVGAGGQIGKVPLVLSAADGRWRWAGGALTLSGGATVSDAADPARFNPLVSRDMALTLSGDRLKARADLLEPTTATKVVAVELGHDLRTSVGAADLKVAGIRFTPALQPEKLTRLTLGIVANVDAAVRGSGRIDWTPAAVTSRGDFRVEAASLAAPFGPVTGVAGDIRFTDLLGLVTAPDQAMTVKAVNPGILVEDGVVRYAIRPGLLLALEGARWPFAGGELTLRPTVLDFSEEAARRLTFDIAALDAARFIEKLEFKNLAGTGIFDGTLPMIFDRDGGRIEGGRLIARAPGGTLSYVGEVSNANLGIWGGIAFDALKSIAYQGMTIDMNGRLDGEMVSRIRFAGVSRGTIKPVATGLLATIGGRLARQLQQLPFVFNINIRAPFRGLIGTARSFYDPSLLINDRLGPAFQAQQPVQPQESETKR